MLARDHGRSKGDGPTITTRKTTATERFNDEETPTRSQSTANAQTRWQSMRHQTGCLRRGDLARKSLQVLTIVKVPPGLASGLRARIDKSMISKRMSRTVVALVSLAVTTTVGAEPGKIRPWPNPIPNSYIVVLKDAPGLDVADAARGLAHAHGGKVRGIMTAAIKAFGFNGNEQAAIALSHNPNVAWIEQDAYLELSPQVNYTNDDHWALDRIDQEPPVNSTKSFGWTLDGTGVRAYVVDTGVRGTHQEFGGRVVAGANMTARPGHR